MSKKTLFIGFLLSLAFSFSCQHYSKNKGKLRPCCAKKAKMGLQKACCAKKAKAGGPCCGAVSSAGQADVLAVDGSKIKGSVFFESAGDFKIKVSASFKNLTPNKQYGFHIHEFGLCGSKALLAGAHLNPYGSKKHGGPKDRDRHLGDLGNLQADSKGRALYSAVLPGKVKKVLGRSVILHAKKDDLKSQPSGKSGARIACGVIVAVMPPVSSSSVEEKTDLVPAAVSPKSSKPVEEEEPVEKKAEKAPPASGPAKAVKKQSSGEKSKEVKKKNTAEVPVAATASSSKTKKAKVESKKPAVAETATPSAAASSSGKKAKAESKKPTVAKTAATSTAPSQKKKRSKKPSSADEAPAP